MFRRGLADADLLDHARFLGHNGLLMVLFGRDRAVRESTVGVGERTVDAAAFDRHVFVAKVHLLIHGSFNGVRAHADRAVVHVALADAEVFLHDLNRLVTACIECVVAGSERGLAAVIGGGSKAAIRRAGGPAFRAPLVCAFIEIDAALVIEDVVCRIVLRVAQAVYDDQVSAATQAFGIDFIVVVAEEEVLELRPETLVIRIDS